MMNTTGRRTGDYGVSESIGFLLIFGMVIVGIGLVTLYGYPMLIQQQTSADKQIMQKNMIVLQNDMKSLAYKTVPYKETMLNIGGGSLTVYNSNYIPTIAPNNKASIDIFPVSSGPGAGYVNSFHPGSLLYHSPSAGVDISLQNGAVVTREFQVGGSAMLAQPRWFYDATTDTMVVNLINLSSSYPIARQGVGTVQMTMKNSSFSVYPIPAGTTVCLRYTQESGQDYKEAWDNYLVNTMKMTKGGGGCAGTDYRLPLGSPGTLVIKEYDVEILSI
jgi:hypothetical protein